MSNAGVRYFNNVPSEVQAPKERKFKNSLKLFQFKNDILGSILKYVYMRNRIVKIFNIIINCL